MQAACFLALLGLLALSAPAANARQLKQSAVTDADILNFALNLEVRLVGAHVSCGGIMLLAYAVHHMLLFSCVIASTVDALRVAPFG